MLKKINFRKQYWFFLAVVALMWNQMIGTGVLITIVGLFFIVVCVSCVGIYPLIAKKNNPKILDKVIAITLFVSLVAFLSFGATSLL